jgi:DMSO/TMAO reductase YedYZ molybdopterin-dependent catalytic subunit
MERKSDVRTRLGRTATGLAAGALLGAALLAVFALGTKLGQPNTAFVLFEWLTRVLPGRLVIFGLETTLRALEAAGLSIKDASKATEEALALFELFAASAVAGAVFFALVRPAEAPRMRRLGVLVGAVAGALMLVPVLSQGGGASTYAIVVDALWVLIVFLLWGWALGWLFAVAYPSRSEVGRPAEAAPGEIPGPRRDQPPRAREAPGPRAQEREAPGPPAPARATVAPVSQGEAQAERMDRRHFVIRMGGLVATFVVLGAEVAEVLRVAGGPAAAPVTKAPIPFPNAGSPVRPVPGTRPEYTPVAEHYRVDIDLSPPSIDADSWRLRVSGLVDAPAQLTLDQLRTGYPKRDQFITLECISNPVGGPLIGTTLWSGPSFRDVLEAARPQPAARYAHMLAEDGFDEVVSLATVRSDPRVLLAYDWNGEPLTEPHGFPLRVYIPGLYGMKQPKWITDIVLVPDFVPGYWVTRGWDKEAVRRTTSVIDTVATGDLVRRGARTFVPVGGIADAGDRGISSVEVQVDGGPWERARLRQPLSELTWVIWRYEWPWAEGQHTFAVRAYDGDGVLQTSATNPTYPSGATGIDTKQVNILPI